MLCSSNRAQHRCSDCSSSLLHKLKETLMLGLIYVAIGMVILVMFYHSYYNKLSKKVYKGKALNKLV